VPNDDKDSRHVTPTFDASWEESRLYVFQQLEDGKEVRRLVASIRDRLAKVEVRLAIYTAIGAAVGTALVNKLL